MVKCPSLRPSAKRTAGSIGNSFAEQKDAGWDCDILAIELRALIDVDFDVELTGFGLKIGLLSSASAIRRDIDPRCGPAIAHRITLAGGLPM